MGLKEVTYVATVDRLVIVGGPGSGKSTLARAAATALSAPHVELDAVWWQAGWVHLEAVEFAERVRDILDRERRWVVDGNYVAEIAEVVWPAADAIVWLDVPRRTAVRRAVLRSARRAMTREELWNGNRQGFDVLRPSSIARLWSRWPGYNDSVRLAIDRMDANFGIVRLTSSKDVGNWLADLGD